MQPSPWPTCVWGWQKQLQWMVWKLCFPNTTACFSPQPDSGTKTSQSEDFVRCFVLVLITFLVSDVEISDVPPKWTQLLFQLHAIIIFIVLELFSRFLQDDDLVSTIFGSNTEHFSAVRGENFHDDQSLYSCT